jgi:ribonuclease Z
MTSGMQVRLLGTGGAANEGRHQASLLVGWGDESAGGRLLLDTGSGLDVVRQLITAGCTPTAVRDIFVSHQHVDHIGGLEPLLLWSVIRSFREHGRPPDQVTRVYGEPRVLADVRRLLEAIASVAPRLFGDRLQLVSMPDGARIPIREGGQLTTFLVDHQPREGGAMGCVVELDGIRLAYSGDTRPTDRLIEAARDIDVLVHEVGGLDKHAAEVHQQGHSTAGDAGRAARAAGVGRLVLSHVPVEALAASMLAEAQAAFGGPVELATDGQILEP